MTKVKVQDLKPGEMVDLEGDTYADPEDASIEFEYKVVWEMWSEWPDYDHASGHRLIVAFEDDSVYGFPYNHEVTVDTHGLVSFT